MNFMTKLERKFGRYAIPELHKYLIIIYFIGFLIGNLGNGFLTLFLSFEVESILSGQIWRLVTWVLCGAGGGGVFEILFMLCLIPMGKHLELFLGTFRMNLYYFGGLLLNVVGGFLVYGISYLILGAGLPVMLTPYYILLSTFMALAICIPDATVNLYFVLPIKMKWMLLVYLLGLVYDLVQYYQAGGWFLVAILGSQIIFALLNLFLFFWFAQVRVSRKQKQRQREFRAKMNSGTFHENRSHHKCVICGRTEKDDPGLTFRYCSKCTGNKEYCQDHLFTHTHQ